MPFLLLIALPGFYKKGDKNIMAITRLKFESFFSIIKNKSLKDDVIIRVAIEEYDVNLTKKDLELMRKNYESLIYKYIN